MVDNQDNLAEAERIDLEAAVLAIYSYVYTQGVRNDVYAKMQEVLEPHGIAEGNIDKVRRAVTRHGGQLPLAIVADGFSFAWDEVGVPEELAKKAINLMKQEEIIVQCGRGYGKAIVLVRSSFDLFDNNYRAEAIGVNEEEEGQAARQEAEEELDQVNELEDEVNDMADQIAEEMGADEQEEAEPRPQFAPAPQMVDDADGVPEQAPELFDEYVEEANDPAAPYLDIADEEFEDMTPEQLLRTLNEAGDTFLNILESLQRDVARPILKAQKAVRKIQEDMEAQPDGNAEELQAEIDRLKKELERAKMVAWQ